MLWFKFRNSENASMLPITDKTTCVCSIKKSDELGRRTEMLPYIYVSPFTQAGRQEEERKLREKLLPLVSFVPSP